MSSDWVHMHNASVLLPGLWSVTGSLQSSLCSTVGIHRWGEEEVELFASRYSVSHAYVIFLTQGSDILFPGFCRKQPRGYLES